MIKNLFNIMNTFTNEGITVTYIGEKPYGAPTFELTIGTLEVTAICRDKSVHYMAYNEFKKVDLPPRALAMREFGEDSGYSVVTTNPTVAVTIARWMKHFNE